MLDDHSRYLVGLFALQSTQAQPVCEKLTDTFQQYGIPEALLMDHGTPWWNTQSSAGWTWLTVWLMRQGIRRYLRGIRNPQTQGKRQQLHGCTAQTMDRRAQTD